MTALAFADPPDHPLDEALVDWLLEPGDLDAEEPVADHLFQCGRCAARVESLREVVAALAELRRHAHEPIQTRATLAALERRGERLQHLFATDGAEFIGDIADDADILILHLPVRAPARGPLAVLLCTPDGHPFFEVEAARAEEGEVMLACHRSVARGNPSLRVQVKDGAAVLCDAVFTQRTFG